MQQWFLLIIIVFSFFYSDIAFAQPGQKHFLRHIYIAGNKITKTDVILREINLREGDSTYVQELKNALIQSRSQLLNTSLFLNVELTDTLVSEKTIDIYVRVVERWYIVPTFQFQLADRNFNEWWQHKQLYRTTFGVGVTHFNFRGRNERLGAEIVLGWRQSLLLRYKNPYLNKKKTLGLNTALYYQRGHEVGFLTKNNQLQFLRVDNNFIFRKTGFETALIYRKQHRISHIAKFALENYSVADTLAKIRNVEYLGQARNNILLPRLSYQFIYDSRNNVFYPVSGHYFSFVAEQKGIKNVLSGINILSADFTLRKFIPFTQKLSLSTNIKAQINSADTLPYIFRSSLGYRHQVRGYEHYVMDGNAAFLIANELRFKAWEHNFKLNYLPFEQFNTIPIALYPKVFFDKGYVAYPFESAGNNLLNRWLDGYGIGLDITSYYDKIMRLEYSYNNLGESELFLHYLEVF